LFAVAVATISLLSIAVGAVQTLPTGFRDEVVLDGLDNPTNVEFARDGHVFVAEKSGLIKVYDDLSDPTPSTFADLRTNDDAKIGGVVSRWTASIAGPMGVRAPTP
jgi:glucose/arabinose dehydrogenase